MTSDVSTAGLMLHEIVEANAGAAVKHRSEEIEHRRGIFALIFLGECSLNDNANDCVKTRRESQCLFPHRLLVAGLFIEAPIHRGAHNALLRRDIAQLSASGLSLMPEELEAAIPVEQMADLIAFLPPPP